MDACTNLLQKAFIIFIQTSYLATGSNLSWVEPDMVKLTAISREQVEINQIKQLLKVLISELI